MKNTTGSSQRASRHSAVNAGLPRLRTVALSAGLIAVAVGLSGAKSGVAHAEPASACANYGGWFDVKTGHSLDRGELFGDIVAKNAVVLLGESHTDVDHHLWQLHTIAALYGRGEISSSVSKHSRVACNPSWTIGSPVS